ncbi:MAG: thioredoxin [Oscillospiraceae bacterium]|nr:thioredoxin [Oscillospiraceae bacterium]
MAVIEVTKENFEAEVLRSEIPVLADFNADWCGPCRTMRPMLDELAEEQSAYKIVSINIDDEDELAEEYDVSSIPCLVVFRGGEEADRSVGLISKDSIAALMEE